MNRPRRRDVRALGNMFVRAIENSEKSSGLHVDVSFVHSPRNPAVGSNREVANGRSSIPKKEQARGYPI
jgi:hypothetical protein